MATTPDNDADTDPDMHPCAISYAAGWELGRSLAESGLDADDADPIIREHARSYEDRELFRDNAWDAFHKHS